MSLTICIRVIDHWVWFTLSQMHLCHWPKCIGVIDHPLRRYKKACVSAPVTLTICTRDIDWVWFTHSICMHPWHWQFAPVTLTECDLHSVSVRTRDIDYMHPWHWPSPKEIQKSLRLGTRDIDNLHPWHWLSLIYTQYLYATVTLTICTGDIDWVWFTLSICAHPWHWLYAPVRLTIP